MDRSTLYSGTKLSTSSRSLVWALCDKGVKLGAWPAKLQQPKDRDWEATPSQQLPDRHRTFWTRGAAEQGKDDTSRWAVWQLKVSHFKLSWTGTAPQLKGHRRCYRLAGKKVVWTLSFPILRGKTPVIWTLLCAVFSWGYWEHAALLLALVNSGVVTLWTGKEIPEVQEYPFKQY